MSAVLLSTCLDWRYDYGRNCRPAATLELRSRDVIVGGAMNAIVWRVAEASAHRTSWWVPQQHAQCTQTATLFPRPDGQVWENPVGMLFGERIVWFPGVR